MIRANMVSAGSAIAEVWDHEAYADGLLYDGATESVAWTGTLYDTNHDGEYLNVAYASSGTKFTYTALKACKVVAVFGTTATVHNLDVGQSFTNSSLNTRHLILVYPA